MKRYDELKDLLTKAGQYPELQLVHNATDKVYECPLCGGSGDIEGVHVSQGTATSGSGLDISITGVQVFGIGDAMQAMEKLIPLAIHHLPELITASEDAARILAQRDRLAELLREVETGLDMFGGFPCTCRKIKDALAELDEENHK